MGERGTDSGRACEAEEVQANCTVVVHDLPPLSPPPAAAAAAGLSPEDRLSLVSCCSCRQFATVAAAATETVSGH